MHIFFNIKYDIQDKLLERDIPIDLFPISFHINERVLPACQAEFHHLSE